MTDSIETISVEEAAAILGKPAQFVRLGLQQERLSFGAAVKGSGGRYSYVIPKKKFLAWLESDQGIFFNEAVKLYGRKREYDDF